MLKFMLYGLGVIVICSSWGLWWEVQLILGEFLNLLLMEFKGFFIWSGLGGWLGIDCLSHGLILLTVWVCMLMILAMWESNMMMKYGRIYMVLLSLWFFLMVMSFFSSSMFMFYVFLS